MKNFRIWKIKEHSQNFFIRGKERLIKPFKKGAHTKKEKLEVMLTYLSNSCCSYDSKK